MVAEDFLIISFYESMGANDPRVWWRSIEPQGHGWQDLLVNNYALLHTKYRSCMLHAFRRFFLKKVIPSMSMEA